MRVAIWLPRRPQGSPLGGSMGPRWPQERPKSLQETLKMGAGGFRDVSNEVPRIMNESGRLYLSRLTHWNNPWWSQDGPEMAPR